MTNSEPHLTGQERFFDPGEFIVSKTDTTGRITYANDVFQRVAGYREDQLLGQPHNIVHHPDMPRAVLKLLWDTIASGKEIFAYVVNRAINGDHYWVYAHVTPSYDNNGTIISYHSTRRVPERDVLDNAIIPLYAQLCGIEQQHANTKEGMNPAFDAVVALLNEKGIGYDEFVMTL